MIHSLRYHLRRGWHRLVCRVFRSHIQEEFTQAHHQEFGWLWQENAQGGQYIAQAEQRGRQEMLSSIRASLWERHWDGWCGGDSGDIEVMMAVDAMIEAAKDSIVLKLDGRYVRGKLKVEIQS